MKIARGKGMFQEEENAGKWLAASKEERENGQRQGHKETDRQENGKQERNEIGSSIENYIKESPYYIPLY